MPTVLKIISFDDRADVAAKGQKQLKIWQVVTKKAYRLIFNVKYR